MLPLQAALLFYTASQIAICDTAPRDASGEKLQGKRGDEEKPGLERQQQTSFDSAVKYGRIEFPIYQLLGCTHKLQAVCGPCLLLLTRILLTG